MTVTFDNDIPEETCDVCGQPVTWMRGFGWLCRECDDKTP